MKFKNVIVIGDNVKPETYTNRDPKIARGNPEFIMSRSELTEFASNPFRWKTGVPEYSSKSTDFGSLMDVLVLTPERFTSLYVETPRTYRNSKGEEVEWTNKSSTCRDWVDEQNRQGLTALQPDDLSEAQKAFKMLRADTRAWELIQCSKRQMMIVATYVDETTKIEVPLKILLDLVPDKAHPEFGKSLADYKTSRDANKRVWSNFVAEHGYDVQAALYFDIYQQAFPNEDRMDFRHVIQENTPPFVTGRRIMSHEFMEIGRMKYRAALRDYCVCLATGVWPNYDDNGEYDGWSLAEPKEWMVGASYGLGLQLPPKPEVKPKDDGDVIP